MSTTNHQFRLAARPEGMAKRSDWDYTEEPIPAPGEGELLVKLLYISLDPAMRGWMNDQRSYVPPVAIGEVMRAIGVAEVIESNNAEFSAGGYVVGLFGVQEYAISDGGGVVTVDPGLAPLPVYLGALGMTGMTAYIGLLDVGAAKEGETVLVSGAAGAVGRVVGHLAKIKGCRAVGIAGGAEKCSWIVDELGFDAAIDYKAEAVGAKLREHCPSGVDVYFDNVGGEILDNALAALAPRGRVVICGAISQYNEAAPDPPKNYLSLLVNRGRMEGFIVFDFASRYAEATAEMAGWIADGELQSRQHVVEGFDTFPETFLQLFTGENVGKLVLQAASPE